MVVINNQTGVQLVYLTLSENTATSTPVYSFSATSKDRNIKVTFDLIVIESNSRWDVCEIDGSLFEEGQMTYEVTETTIGNVVERGLLISNDSSQVSGWDSYEENDEADQDERGRL